MFACVTDTRAGTGQFLLFSFKMMTQIPPHLCYALHFQGDSRAMLAARKTAGKFCKARERC